MTPKNAHLSRRNTLKTSWKTRDIWERAYYSRVFSVSLFEKDIQSLELSTKDSIFFNGDWQFVIIKVKKLIFHSVKPWAINVSSKGGQTRLFLSIPAVLCRRDCLQTISVSRYTFMANAIKRFTDHGI